MIAGGRRRPNPRMQPPGADAQRGPRSRVTLFKPELTCDFEEQALAAGCLPKGVHDEESHDSPRSRGGWRLQQVGPARPEFRCRRRFIHRRLRAADAIGDSAGAPSMEGRFSRNRWRLWLPREASCFRIGLRLSTPAHLHACSDGTLRNHAPSRSHLLAARLVTYST